ncbi:MAG TPA: hypothetical protein H9662_09955 [Firmicutes bacterium]|nr:hypothetical protein [Bacillota bacterium]
MDDLTNQLNAFLSSEDGMQKLQQLASALSSSGGNQGEGNSQGGGGSPSPPQNGQGNNMPDLSGLMSMLSNSGLGSAAGSQNHSGEAASNPLAGLDVGMIMKIQQALSAYNQDDKNTVLLKSLKPHLRPERQGRVDEALKLMKLVSLLPLFVQSGLFGSGGER